MEKLHVLHTYDRQPGVVHIRLEKNSRGFNWEVSYSHENEEIALRKIKEVNEKLRAEFGEESNTN